MTTTREKEAPRRRNGAIRGKTTSDHSIPQLGRPCKRISLHGIGTGYRVGDGDNAKLFQDTMTGCVLLPVEQIFIERSVPGLVHFAYVMGGAVVRQVHSGDYSFQPGRVE